MAKIIVLNLGTEHALQAGAALPHSLAKSVWRHAWLLDAGDILLSPMSIDCGHVAYIAQTLGFDARRVELVTHPALLSDEILAQDDVVAALRLRMDPAASYTMMSCYASPGVGRLARLLGCDDGAGQAFLDQRGPDLFNRKSHFRQLAAGMAFPIPDGAVVRGAGELARAIDRLLAPGGAVIVKQDHAAGGLGNIVLTEAEPHPVAGARETRRLDRGGIAATAERLWPELAATGEPLIIERYDPALWNYYHEYRLDSDGAPAFIASGTIRVRANDDPNAPGLVWVGLDIPAQVPPEHLAAGRAQADRFAAFASMAGYRGFINVDSMTSAAGVTMLNETNARWGGGLVLHEVARRLLGDTYAEGHVVSSLRDVLAPPRPALVAALEHAGLAFATASSEGVVVLACDEHDDGLAECLVCANSLAQSRAIEERLRAALRDAPV